MLITDYLLIGASFISIYLSLVFLLIYLANRKKIHRIPRLPKKLPKVSILVPAYNEEKTLERTVKSLVNLNYPRNLLEIIIINDGSTDRTGEIANLLARKFRIVKALHKKNGGKASALNFGLKHAKGELIVVMDADSYVEKNALIKTVGYFNDPKVSAVATSVKVSRPRNILQKLQWYEYLFNIFYRKIQAFIDSVLVIPGPFGIYRKSVLEKLGGFDEKNITEDMEITLRLQKHGYRIETSDTVFTYTESPKTLRGLINQRIRWYRGYLINARKYKELFFNPKYKDFGMFMMPSYIITVMLSLIVIVSSVYAITRDLTRNLISYLYAKYVPISISIPQIQENLSLTPLYLGITSISSFLILVFFGMLLYISLKISKEKIKNKKEAFNLLIFAFIYFYILGYTWIMSIIKELIRERPKWYE